MLDITMILHNSRTIETDVYYKTTNTHDSLRYESHHTSLIKQNNPYHLANRIIVFVSDSQKEETRSKEVNHG